MSIDRLTQLKTLHLYGMAAAWNEWQAEHSAQKKPVMPEVWWDRLIAAEQAWQSRSAVDGLPGLRVSQVAPRETRDNRAGSPARTDVALAWRSVGT